MSRPSSLFGDYLNRPQKPDAAGTVLSVSPLGTVDVQLASGEIVRRVDLAGAAAAGDEIRLRYDNGRYVAQGSRAGGDRSGGAYILGGSGSGSTTGAPSPHDLLGVHHTLPTLSANLFLASPSSTAGLPSFRAIVPADLPGQFAGFANPTAQVGLTAVNGVATTAMRSDAAPSLSQAITPTWSGLHTFSAGQRVSSSQVVEFGWSVAGKQTDAGKIGYQTFSTALDIVGAGTASGQRAIKLWDNTWIAGYVGSESYTSQTTGWRIDSAGGGDFRYLFTDEMHAKSFIADLEQALAGGQIISKSVAMMGKTFTAPAAAGTATLWVRDLPSAANMAAFQSGDIVRIRTFNRSAGSLSITDCWGVVTSYADGSGADEGLQSWTFTRSSAPNAGAMTAGTTVPVDAIILDYGVSGNGIWETNAIDGAYGVNSPYTQAVQWTGHPATGSVVRYRAGKLDGWGSGYAGTNTFGFAAGNTSGTWIAAEATNGFRVMFGSTVKGQWDTSGNLVIGEVGAGKSNVFVNNAGTLYVRDNTTNVIRLSSSTSTSGAFSFGTIADFNGTLFAQKVSAGNIDYNFGVVRGYSAVRETGSVTSTFQFTGGQGHAAWATYGSSGLLPMAGDVGRIYTDVWRSDYNWQLGDAAFIIETLPVDFTSSGIVKTAKLILKSASGVYSANDFSVTGNVTASNALLASNWLLVGNYSASQHGGIGAGLTTKNYSPTSTTWPSESTLILTAAGNSTIGFHHSGNRVDFIRCGGGTMTLGYDGGFGAAAIHAPSTIRSDGGFNRNGVAGGIYVPISPFLLTDTGGFTYSASSSRTTGSRVATLNANGNSIPVGAKAVYVLIGAYWASTSNAYYMYLDDGSGLPSVVVRAATTLYQESTGIVNINGSHQIAVVINGLTADNPYIRVLGYFY